MLRAVRPEDIAVFFDHQNDRQASEMAAFPIRDRDAHDRHWTKVLANESNVARTIVAEGEVVGNIGSWVAEGGRELGFWIGRSYWGRGYATRALAEFIGEVPDRPLFAHVAEHNVGSLRVLTKCGFEAVGEQQDPGDPIKEIVLRLN